MISMMDEELKTVLAIDPFVLDYLEFKFSESSIAIKEKIFEWYAKSIELDVDKLRIAKFYNKNLKRKI